MFGLLFARPGVKLEEWGKPKKISSDFFADSSSLQFRFSQKPKISDFSWGELDIGPAFSPTTRAAPSPLRVAAGVISVVSRQKCGPGNFVILTRSTYCPASGFNIC